jgi:TatA/E family protein of Tat protein translocase
MLGTLGGPELFLILVIALIVFGPRKLPEIGKSLGRMMNEFKKASNEFRQTLEDEVEADKLREAVRLDSASAVPAHPAPAPVAVEPAGTPIDPAGTPVVEPADPPADTVSRAEASEGIPRS